MDTIILSNIIYGLVLGSMYAVISVGFTLIFGVMKITNFSHGEFFMLGAYLTYFGYVFLIQNSLVVMMFSSITIFLIGIAVEKLLLTPLRKCSTNGGDWLTSAIILTIGLSMFIQNTALYVWKSDYRGIPYHIYGVIDLVGIKISLDRLVIFIFGILIIVILRYVLIGTKIGKAIRAVSQDYLAAELMGINSENIYMVTFGFGCMLSAIAGSLFLPILYTYPTVGLMPMTTSFVVVILGGLGNVYGTIAAGFMIGILESVLITYFKYNYVRILIYTIIIIVLILRSFELHIFKIGKR